MKTRRIIPILFAVAALYDGILGAAFLFASGPIFEWFCIPPPNHPGYAQFPAALLIVFAIMFAAIATNPQRNRNLIPYGILLKVVYCSVISLHWFTTDLPGMWKPFCVFDFIFLICFVWAWLSLGASRETSDRGPTNEDG